MLCLLYKPCFYSTFWWRWSQGIDWSVANSIAIERTERTRGKRLEKMGSESKLRIELFGGLRVQRQGGPAADVSRQQSGALLAYLALYPERTHNRDELIAFLWPEDDAESGRRKLRQSVYNLRKLLEPDELAPEVFIAGRDTLRLNPQTTNTDVTEFEAAVEGAARSVNPEEKLAFLDTAHSVYRGELLAGFYQDEFLARRGLLAAKHRAVQQERSRVHESLGNIDTAIDAAREIIAEDPLVEEAHADLMRLYAAAGRPSEVRRQFRELEQVLAAELGVEPTETIRALAQKLQTESELSVPVRSSNGSLVSAERDRPNTPRRKPSARLLLGVGGVCLLLLALGGTGLIGRIIGLPKAPSKTEPKAAPATRPEYEDGHLLRTFSLKPSAGDRDSEPVAIVSDQHGYFWMGGFVQTLNHDVDMLVAKFDPNGIPLGRHQFNGDGNDVDRLKAMAVDREGNVYFTGEAYGLRGLKDERLSELDIVTVKLDRNLKPVWKKTYNGPGKGLDSPADIKIDEQGNVYVAGRSRNAGSATFAMVVMKYSPTGRKLWEYRYPTAGADTRAVNLSISQAGVCMAGYLTPTGKPAQNILAMLDAATGKLRWEHRTRGVPEASDSAPRVCVDRENQVYFATEIHDGVDEKKRPLSRVRLTALSETGKVIWETNLRSKPDGYPTDLVADPRGGVAVAGMQRRLYYGILVASVAPTGEVRYARKWTCDPGHSPPRVALSVDESGNTAALGTRFHDISGPKGTVFDTVTLYVEAVTGRAWRHVYDGPDHRTDRGGAITISNGSIYSAIQAEDGGVRTTKILKYSTIPDQVRKAP